MGTNVRRHMMAGVLTVAAVLMAFFIPVFADDEVYYPVYVGDQHLSSSVTSGDGWSYEGDETGGTLTLTNATIPEEYYYGISAYIPLKIVLVGENTVEKGGLYGIYCEGNLTIEGSGSLEVSGGKAGIRAKGLTINKTTITAKSDDLGLECEKWNYFTITDSTVTCDAAGAGIYSNGCRLIIKNSKVTAHGGDCGINTTALEILDGSRVVAESDDRVGIVAPEEFIIDGGDVTAKGKTQGVEVLAFKLKAGKFRSSGSDMAVSYAYGITLGDDMHIVSPENGSLQSVYENYNNHYFFANSDGSIATDVFVRDSKVQVVANAATDLVAIDKPMADEGDTVTVTVKNTFYYVLRNITAKDSEGRTVALQDVGDGKYKFTMPAEDVKVNVEFVQPEKYPVWIGEHQVTGDNDSGEGWSCAVDKEGAALILDGINIDNTADALKSDIPLTIVLAGENNLAGTGQYSINASSALEIRGEGSLSLTGTLKGQGDIVISEDAKIKILNSENGIMTTGVLTIDNSAVDIKGKTNAIYVNGGEVKISNSTVNCITSDNYCIYAKTVSFDKSKVSAQGKYGIHAKTLKVENGSSLGVDSFTNGATGDNFSSGNSKVDIKVQESNGLNFLQKIELLSGTVSVKSRDSGAVVSGNGTLTLGENMNITVPEGGQISGDGKTIVDANNVEAKEVVLKGTYHVTVDGRSRVTVDKTDVASGETVNFSIMADDRYIAFREVKVIDQDGGLITVTDNGDRTFSFNMPESAVTIKASFEDAEAYNLTVNGEALTSFVNSGTGWKYEGDKTGGTLYLENALISHNYSALVANAPLTLVLKGDNVIEQQYGGYAISSNSPVTIKGEGKLSVKGPVMGINAGGITICDGATVTVEGDYAMNSNGKGISITDSNVIAKARYQYAMLDSSGNIVIKNSTVECSSPSNAIITTALTIDNSTVKVTGNVGINEFKTLSVLNGSDLTVNSKSDGINGGSISFSDSIVHVESENSNAITCTGIEINSGSVSAKGSYTAIYSNSRKLSLGEDMVILIPENGKVNEEKNTIINSDGRPAPEVLIKQNYKVTVTYGDHGNASASVTSGLEGTEVTLTATPDEGCIFKEWQVIQGGISVSDPGSETATLTIGTADVEVKAIFETKPAPSPEPTATPTATPVPSAEPTKAADPTTIPSATPTSAAKPSVKPTKAAEPTKASDVTLKLDKTKADLVCGKTLSLKATLTGSKDKINWKSSNTKIATVDAQGKVTAKMAGQVTITAQASGKTATATVTVLYKDVTNTKDFWFAPTNYLTAKGVVKGYDNQTKFKPANNCTRAQMVTFIWRLAGEPAPKAKTCKFKDVKKTDYFYKACIWGNENHIVEGYKDGTFGPQIVCARKHAVTFLWRLAGQPKPASAKNKFKDVKEKDYFYKATLWASEKKILAGYSDGTFRPDGDCLRRQMVTFLYKFDKNAGTTHK